MAKKIGTFNAKNVYEVSKQEYIEKSFYLIESNYYAIADDIVMVYGLPFKKFIYRNRVKGLLNQSNSILEERKCADMDKVYYVQPTGYERSAAKEDQGNKEFDVDAFLGSPQSVDEYLEMMKNVDYGSNLCDCTV